MSKNTEILGDFLKCMVKLTDKLHQTNKKVIDACADIEHMKEVDSISSSKIEVLEIKMNNLTTSEIIEKDETLIETLNENTKILENTEK